VVALGFQGLIWQGMNSSQKHAVPAHLESATPQFSAGQCGISIVP
jgi:hypothetical protein